MQVVTGDDDDGKAVFVSDDAVAPIDAALGSTILCHYRFRNFEKK